MPVHIYPDSFSLTCYYLLQGRKNHEKPLISADFPSFFVDVWASVWYNIYRFNHWLIRLWYLGIGCNRFPFSLLFFGRYGCNHASRFSCPAYSIFKGLRLYFLISRFVSDNNLALFPEWLSLYRNTYSDTHIFPYIRDLLSLLVNANLIVCGSYFCTRIYLSGSFAIPNPQSLHPVLDSCVK